MTDLQLAPEVVELKEHTRVFARDRLARLAKDAEDAQQVLPEIVRSLNQLGVLSPLDPEVDRALDPVAMAIVAEELAVGDPGVAYEAMVGAHAVLAVNRLGSEQQRQGIVAAGKQDAPALGSLWFYEGFGRGPDEYTTTVRRSGDEVVVAGNKIAVVRPGTADFAVVVGWEDRQCAAAVLSHADIAGVTVRRDDRTGGKLGLNAAHTGNVAIRGLKLPADALLAQGTDLSVDRIVASARLCVAAVAIGAGAAAVNYAAHYANERSAFGKPIAEYQGVSFPLAEADMQLRTARDAILDLAWRLSEIRDAAELVRQTGWVVAAATQAALRATRTGINTLGGHGFLTDHPVERWYRAAGVLAAIDNDPILFG